MDSLQDIITQFSTKVSNIVDEAMSEFDFEGLSYQQLHYLWTIYRMKNPSISELAKELKLTKSTVTVLVDKLVEKNYIRKVQSDEDRRFLHLHINEKGLKISSVFNVASGRLLDNLKHRLNESELEILIILLRKVV